MNHIVFIHFHFIYFACSHPIHYTSSQIHICVCVREQWNSMRCVSAILFVYKFDAFCHASEHFERLSNSTLLCIVCVIVEHKARFATLIFWMANNLCEWIYWIWQSATFQHRLIQILVAIVDLHCRFKNKNNWLISFCGWVRVDRFHFNFGE